MYALAVQNIPEGKEWLYEVKFDGYRCIVGKSQNGVTLWLRRGNDFTSQFPHIARACERLPIDTLLDGEIMAIDKSGRISFNLLQHHRSHAQALLFYAFDVIVHRGENLVNAPLEKRQTVLNEIFEDLGKNASAVCQKRLMPRQKNLSERPKKSDLRKSWPSAKLPFTNQVSEVAHGSSIASTKGRSFVIGEYVPDNPFDSIIVGYYQDGKLMYAAKVRNGFVAHTPVK